MSENPVLSIRNLVVTAVKSGQKVLDDISIDVAPGEVVALIGESGSGKTTLSLGALGYFRSGLQVTGGNILLQGRDLLKLSSKELKGIRGSEVSYVSQSAAASFNPAFRLDKQVIEPSLVHGSRSKAEAMARARALFGDLGLPDPDTIGRRFPHQVSGGQLQRFMAAMALMDRPSLVVFDEPTTALDVTTQVGVLKEFKRAIKQRGTAAIYVSHDLAVVAQIADRVVILRNGKMVEQGLIKDILEAPQEEYTRQLLDAQQRWDRDGHADAELAEEAEAPAAVPLLMVEHVTAGYGKVTADGTPSFPTVKSISLSVDRNNILAIIGESGSGKSTLANVICGLHPQAKGAVKLAGQTLSPTLWNRSLDERRRVQLVMQMPDTALNPRHTVGRILGRVLKQVRGLNRADRTKRIAELLDMVSLPQSYVDRRSTALSGGEKQRVNLARALAAEPDLLICDEITAALDTIVAESVLQLLKDLSDRLGVAIIFISHDLATVARLADEIAVMQRGSVVETGKPGMILSNPQASYTRQLVASVPEPRVGWLEDTLAAASQK